MTDTNTKPQVLLPNGNPQPDAPFSVKKSDAYGVQIANVICREWFGGTVISKGCSFWERRDKIITNRLFVRAEQETKNFKIHANRSGSGEELKRLNLDWRILNIVAKFCNNVANGIKDEYYRLDIKSADPISIKVKKEKEREYRKNMLAKPMYQKTKEVLGIDMMPQGFIPEDEDELKMRMEIDEKPIIITGEQILIDFIKNTNNWAEIQAKKNKDLVNIGISGVRVYTDKNDGVKLQYVDPENYVHSYVNSNDFSDKYYDGYVDSITIADLKRESGYSDNVLRIILNRYANKGRYNINDVMHCSFNDLIGYKVDVLRFSWKTWKTEVIAKKYRKGKLAKASVKNDLFEVSKDMRGVEKTTRTLDTWFEGNFIIGSDYIFGYKECENIVRDKMNRAQSPFIMRATDIYKNRLSCFLDDLMPIADEMQRVYLKLQNLTSQLKADRTIINVDALADITGSGDKKKNWEMQMAMLNVNNVIIEKTIDLGDEGGVQRVQSARTEATSQGSAIGVLLNEWAFYYNLMRDISGVNPARDGSLSEDALVGVSKMAELASNTNTAHIVSSSVDFDLRMYLCISSRIGEIFKNEDAAHIVELYEQVVGERSIEAREALGDRSLAEFGFEMEMKPSRQVLEQLNSDLTLALQDGTIDVDVKIECEQISKTNYNLAIEYLKHARKKRVKQMQDEKLEAMRVQNEGNMQVAQAAEAAKAQAYQSKKMVDAQFEQMLAKMRVEEAQAMQQIQAPEKDKEFQQEVFLKRLESYNSFSKTEYQEAKKDERLDTQSTYQSELISQRQKDSPPKSFGGSNNWLMGAQT